MNYLIIDLSYYNFYRFYATKGWYTRAHPEDNFEKEYDWSKNAIFWDKFKKMFNEHLKKYIKKLKIDKVIFAKDCKRKDIWRMKFYDYYKGARDENYKKNNFTGGKVFKRCYEEILPELIDNKTYFKIYIDHLEADDIISLSIKYINQKYPKSTINVISSDHDLLQLIDTNVTLMDAKMKSYNIKSYGSNYKDIYIKSILGDKSDSIPKTFKKVGPKTAIKLVENPDLLLDKFKKERGSFDKFILNKLLIDLKLIPNKYKNEFNTLVSNYLNF